METCTVAEHIARLLALLKVILVDEFVVPTAQRNPQDAEAQLFQRVDLAPNEAVTDLGILIDEIGDAHGRLFIFNEMRWRAST